MGIYLFICLLCGAGDVSVPTVFNTLSRCENQPVRVGQTKHVMRQQANTN